MKGHFLTFALVIVYLHIPVKGQIYKDPSVPVQNRVEDLLSKMNIDEKVGQMLQAERSRVIVGNDIKNYYLGSVLSGGGSVPNSNFPKGWADMYDIMQGKALSTRLSIPILYGIDAVHGNNSLYGAVIFPHNIGMGCTRNPELVKKAAHITAIEVAATGLDWTFSPCVAVPQDERWGRTYEGFSENPDLVKVLAKAAVQGYQGDTLSDSLSIIACAKHFLGDGGTTGGDDQGDTRIDEATLRKIHLPGYIGAIESNVASVMASFSSWNRQKMHGNKYLLTDVLKNELGFKGFIVSDWNGIYQLPGNDKDKYKESVNAGIDMLMEPYSYPSAFAYIKGLVNEDSISEERINDAVRRILTVKFEMGLFERPYSNRSLIDSVGTAYHRLVARQCVRESQVLLKKRDKLLPLAKQNLKIHVAGRSADNLGLQCGGWTLSWQGGSGNFITGTTIYKGLQQVAPHNTYTFSSDATGGEGADIGIVVIGEFPYAEYDGDIGSIDSILVQQDIEAVKKMKSYGIPVIVVLVTGRPINISDVYPYADAIIAAWLPGTEGQGVADVIFGDYMPTGRLSHTWPRDNSQLPINFGDANYDPLYAYDYCITTFENSPKKSVPEFYSAFVGHNGQYVELSFNKKINDPSQEIGNFKIKAGPEINTINSIGYAGVDSCRIRIGLKTTIQNNLPVILNYAPGGLMAADSGMVSEIVGYKVKNDSKVQGTNIDGPQTIEMAYIFPNPVIDGCYIRTQEFGKGEMNVEIYGITGKLIKQVKLQVINDTDYYFDVNYLPTGFYLVKLSNEIQVKAVKIQVVKRE
jgi:beta-glucosidase